MRRVRRLAFRWGAGLRLRAWEARHQGFRPGMLSVVVPVYQVEEYLGRCLDSLSRQRYRNVEIIVVDDGSPDQSVALTRRRRLRDPRIRLVRRPNGGLSAARNTGIAAARGEYLVFLDGDDTVEPDAYRAAVESLTCTGSDFAVLPYRRWVKGRIRPAAPWIRAAHRHARTRLTLAQAPWVLVHAVAWDKVYRRSFWERCGVTFPDGLFYEDQAVSMSVFAKAASFDVLAGDGILWRLRDDRSSISDFKTRAKNIAHQRVAARDSLSVLGLFSTAAVRSERLRQLLNNNLSGFIEHIPEMDDDAWAEFRALATYLADEADDAAGADAAADECSAAGSTVGSGNAGDDRDDPSGHPVVTVWDGVEVRKKVVIALARKERRDLAEAFLAAGGWLLPSAGEPRSLPFADEIAEVVGDRILPQVLPLAVPAGEDA
jgi:CDP-glycerol glycerophosphotransferase